MQQADRLDQGVPSKAGIVAHRPVNRQRQAGRRPDVDPNLGADCGPVGLFADELDLEPVEAVARIAEKEVVGSIPR